MTVIAFVGVAIALGIGLVYLLDKWLGKYFDIEEMEE